MSQAEIILPMTDRYPFSCPQNAPNPRAKVQVRKSMQYGLQPRFVMKEKIRMLKNLGFQHLVGLEGTAEAEDHLDLLFEYAPFSFQAHLASLSPEQVDKIRDGMYELAENLANKCVEHEFRVENIGLDRKEHLKYFIGFAFKIDRGMNKEDTLQRYRRIIDYFFACGGPLVKGRSPNKSLKNETADTSSKTAEEASHLLLPTANLMKKSSTVDNSPLSLGQPGRQLLARYTFNCNNNNNQLVIPEEQRRYYEEEKRVETKAVKMDELGARINKLKSYMKEITGKTPTSTSGLAKFSVKIDANNFENKIFQENKIMITPSYTKLEKKIAEFRESKLYRAYNEKEILYSKNNHGYQVLTTHKIQDNSKANPELKAVSQPDIKAITQPEVKPEVKPQVKAVEYVQNVQTQPSRPHRQEERSNHVPSFFLQKKQSLNSAKQSPATSPKSSKQIPTEPASLKGSSSNKSSPFDSYRSNNNNLNTSKHFYEPSDPQEKEYRQLATKDKYCEEFMFFLEGDDDQELNFAEQNEYQPPPPPSPPPQILRNQETKGKGLQNATHNKEIQDRVNKAIRNSIKLINGLKSKD